MALPPAFVYPKSLRYAQDDSFFFRRYIVRLSKASNHIYNL